ncbi:hypothetical protein DR864_28550 (plasmid) [Runella rosea]|uniref:Uncharacterized protein n=1 Tax=Runella rosea TaxID=2259595 RepID=A0A344TT52_9BACT|nr:hypothetical protein [Runella rosea]AXE21823.1 hypothetical protein DR864_28550 [Runella rosea]
MKAENIDIRTQKIRQFIIIYLVFYTVLFFFFYWAFVKIPKAYQKEQALASLKLNEFLENTAKLILWCSKFKQRKMSKRNQ